jgi:hypothetical protein
METAAQALADAERMTLPEAKTRLASTLGMSQAYFRYMPLSATEAARARQLALDTIWKYRYAFLSRAPKAVANLLFGPDHDLLRVLGLPGFSLGILSGRPTPAGSVPVISAAVLAAQFIFTLMVYAMSLRVILQRIRKRRFPTLVWVNLGFAIYVLAMSLTLVTVGEPRYRAPVIPLLVMAGAAGWARKSPTPDTATAHAS